MKKLLAIFVLLSTATNKPSVKILKKALKSLKENPQVTRYEVFKEENIGLTTSDLDEGMHIYSIMIQINKKTQKFSSATITFGNRPKMAYAPFLNAIHGCKFKEKDLEDQEKSPLLKQLIAIIKNTEYIIVEKIAQIKTE